MGKHGNTSKDIIRTVIILFSSFLPQLFLYFYYLDFYLLCVTL